MLQKKTCKSFLGKQGQEEECEIFYDIFLRDIDKMASFVYLLPSGRREGRGGQMWGHLTNVDGDFHLPFPISIVKPRWEVSTFSEYACVFIYSIRISSSFGWLMLMLIDPSQRIFSIKNWCNQWNLIFMMIIHVFWLKKLLLSLQVDRGNVKV